MSFSLFSISLIFSNAIKIPDHTFSRGLSVRLQSKKVQFSFFNEMKLLHHRLRKSFFLFFLSQAVPLSMIEPSLLFPPGSRKRQQGGTGESCRGLDTAMDALLSSCQKPNEDSSEQILRGSPRALTPPDPDDTFLIGPSEHS